jgi:hypothetical protein
MTDRSDLKRRVRERQARTGESYMAALRHVRGQRAGAVPVVELVDVSDIGGLLGIKCRVMLQPALAERVEVATMLRQLHATLVAATREPASWLMRSVVLHGERPFTSPASFGDGVRFLRRLRAGIGGFSDAGSMLSLLVGGRHAAELVMFLLWMTPVRYLDIPPSLIITSPDALLGDGWDVLPLLRSPTRAP